MAKPTSREPGENARAVNPGGFRETTEPASKRYGLTTATVSSSEYSTTTDHDDRSR